MNEQTGNYTLIPMSEIRDEPRKIAVAWHESASNWIGDKHKLASDIQNYADFVSSEKDIEIARLKQTLINVSNEIGTDYRNQCDEVDWYNNNMPGVGQTFDYKSRPIKPLVLQIIDDALKQTEQ